MRDSLRALRRHAARSFGPIIVGMGLALAPAATGITVWVAKAVAQTAMTPEQKVRKMLSRHTKQGDKVSFDSATEEGDVLTVRGLRIATELSTDDPKKPDTRIKKSFLVNLDELIIRKYDYNNPELPLFGDAEAKGMRFDGELVNNREMSEALNSVGLKEIVLDSKIKYEANPQAGLIFLDTYSITLRDMMSFALSLKVDQIDFAKIPKGITRPGFGVPGSNNGASAGGNPGAMFMQVFSTARLHNLLVSLTDLGGIERGLALAAAEQSKKNVDGPKMTVDKVRDQVRKLLAFARTKVAGAFANSAIDAAGQILAKPGTLTLAARPNQPVQFTSLMGFAVMMGANTQMPGQKINLDALQGFLKLTATYTEADR
ncbi:MAG: hypothetical protein OXC93_16685 [Rhodospirillaceae bacterium]|nr:hypothetical protein [Rhodospirillaceae bacterium]